MEFLIKEIIQKFEEINAKSSDCSKDRQSVALEPDKHNKSADEKRKEKGCC